MGCNAKNKNKTIFHITSHSEEVLRRAKCFAISLCNAIKMGGTSTSNRIVQVKWRPSRHHDWIKISIDGAANVNGNWSAIDGVLRDSIVGHRNFIERGFVLKAEL